MTRSTLGMNRALTVAALCVVAVAVVTSAAAAGLAVSAAGDGAAERTTDHQQVSNGFWWSTYLSGADATLQGEAANDRAGRSIADAGDVNGDGVDDVIVGAPFSDAGGGNAGAAYVVYGPVEDGDLSLAEADVVLLGEGDNARAGWSVAGAGDVNDDGVDDVIVGAPLADARGENETGAAYVVYGDESLSGQVNLSEADAVLRGEDAGDRAGWSVAGATDVNGSDGVVVGAPFADDRSGEVYLVEGQDLDGSSGVGTAARATLTGQSDGDHAGWSVAGAGDVNDDGGADVVVGAPYHTPDWRTGAGAAYVVDADAEGTVSLSDAPLSLEGENPRDRAGWSVAGAGDVNDDGVADVVVGAPQHDAAGEDAGAAYLVQGGALLVGDRSIASSGDRVAGEAAGDMAGYDVASAGPGDLTCDGVDDVIVGAPHGDRTADNAGVAYVVSGDDAGAGTDSLRYASTRLYGQGDNDSAGTSVAAGDVNDDGAADALVGAPLRDAGNESNVGTTYVEFSDCAEAED